MKKLEDDYNKYIKTHEQLLTQNKELKATLSDKERQQRNENAKVTIEVAVVPKKSCKEHMIFLIQWIVLFLFSVYMGKVLSR